MRPSPRTGGDLHNPRSVPVAQIGQCAPGIGPKIQENPRSRRAWSLLKEPAHDDRQTRHRPGPARVAARLRLASARPALPARATDPRPRGSWPNAEGDRLRARPVRRDRSRPLFACDEEARAIKAPARRTLRAPLMSACRVLVVLGAIVALVG